MYSAQTVEFFSNDTTYTGNTASLHGDAIASTHPISVDLTTNTFDSNGLRDPQYPERPIYIEATAKNLAQYYKVNGKAQGRGLGVVRVVGPRQRSISGHG